jgi:hypothetical protein
LDDIDLEPKDTSAEPPGDEVLETSGALLTMIQGRAVIRRAQDRKYQLKAKGISAFSH